MQKVALGGARNLHQWPARIGPQNFRGRHPQEPAPDENDDLMRWLLDPEEQVCKPKLHDRTIWVRIGSRRSREAAIHINQTFVQRLEALFPSKLILYFPPVVSPGVLRFMERERDEPGAFRIELVPPPPDASQSPLGQFLGKRCGYSMLRPQKNQNVLASCPGENLEDFARLPTQPHAAEEPGRQQNEQLKIGGSILAQKLAQPGIAPASGGKETRVQTRRRARRRPGEMVTQVAEIAGDGVGGQGWLCGQNVLDDTGQPAQRQVQPVGWKRGRFEAATQANQISQDRNGRLAAGENGAQEDLLQLVGNAQARRRKAVG